MGQLSYEPSIRHFSHPHPLDLANHHVGGDGHPHNPQLPQPLCAGCTLPPHGYMYACKTCNYNFTLHVSCAKLSSKITHPSHPKHRLTLLQSPAYPSKTFNCDACGNNGAAFSYHCNECDFDMHTTCATKPLTVAHRLHHHQLNLEFFPPYSAKGFICDICRNAGSNHWLYRCASCQFDAHLDCATAAVNAGATGQSTIPYPQPQVQPQQQQVHLQQQCSYPGSSYDLPPQYQLQHHNSAPAAVNMGYQNVTYQQPYMQQPAVASPLYAQQQPTFLAQPVYNGQQLQQPCPYLQPQPQMAPAYYGVQQQTMVDIMFQNAVGGVMQGAGEAAFQNMMGGAGANPTAADAGANSSSEMESVTEFDVCGEEF